MTPDLTRRRSLLTAALGFALLDTRGQPAPPEVQTVRRWLDNRTGIGDVAAGMKIARATAESLERRCVNAALDALARRMHIGRPASLAKGADR